MIITRSFIKQAWKDYNFIYGDTYYLDGNGKQSKEARGEINTFAVATKIRPCYNDETSFFYDNQTDPFLHKALILSSLSRITEPILRSEKKIIVFPKLGLGFNEMDKRAPLLRVFLLEQIRHLFGHKIINLDELI